MSQQFVARIVNYVANELIVKGLANSRTFQKFAVRTNKQYEELSKQGTEKMTQTFENLAKQQQQQMSGDAARAGESSNNILRPPQRPLRGIPGFFVAFFKEVKKDFNG